MTYSIKNILDVEDSALKYKTDEFMEARFPREELDAEQTGLAHIRVKPGKRQPFAHFHDRGEEVYYVLSGTGNIKIDDTIESIGPRDAIRLSPGTTHQLEAGPEGLEILAFGPHHAQDGDLVHEGFWD
jgi:mannose-6-phosphate isomerase-like protein (cupin superfamily)